MPCPGITAGPDGNLWFAEYSSNKIGMINPTTHAITEFAVPNGRAEPTESRRAPTATSGSPSDQHEHDRDDQPDHPRRHRVPPSLRRFQDRIGITADPDGNVWFTDRRNNAIGVALDHAATWW